MRRSRAVHASGWRASPPEGDCACGSPPVRRQALRCCVRRWRRVLYASWRRRSPGALSRMARFRVAFRRTLRPGTSMVPLALAVMATTRKSSIATQPWRLATSVVNLWVKSARRRACRARSLAISLMLRRSRFEYRPALCRFAQRSWRALRRSRLSRRRHSPAERVDDMQRGVGSSETNAEQATPKSTPHPGNPLATAGRSRSPRQS